MLLPLAFSPIGLFRSQMVPPGWIGDLADQNIKGFDAAHLARCMDSTLMKQEVEVADSARVEISEKVKISNLGILAMSVERRTADYPAGIYVVVAVQVGVMHFIVACETQHALKVAPLLPLHHLRPRR